MFYFASFAFWILRSFHTTLELDPVVPILRPSLESMTHPPTPPIAALPRRPHSDHWSTQNILLLRTQEQDSRLTMFLRRHPTSLLQVAILGSHNRNDRVLEFIRVSPLVLSNRYQNRTPLLLLDHARWTILRLMRYFRSRLQGLFPGHPYILTATACLRDVPQPTLY